MAAGGSGYTSSAGGGGGGGRGVHPRRSGRCVCICVRCMRGGEEGGWDRVRPGSQSEGRSCPLPGDVLEPPPRREPRRTPPSPSRPCLPSLGWLFPHGQEGVWTGTPREGPGGRAAPLTLCVLSVFLSQGPVSLCAAAGGTIRA